MENYSNFNFEEIQQALFTLQFICQRQEDCYRCPFGTRDDECIFKHKRPRDWEIEENPPIWRAIKNEIG